MQIKNTVLTRNNGLTRFYQVYLLGLFPRFGHYLLPKRCVVTMGDVLIHIN